MNGLNETPIIEMKNAESLITNNFKLNYFPNDQTKHIDYVIHFKDEDLGSDRNRKNPKLIERKQIRNKFLIHLINLEGFEIRKIVKKSDKNGTLNYLLLNCSLDRSD
jgi:hypothetical protein